MLEFFFGPTQDFETGNWDYARISLRIAQKGINNPCLRCAKFYSLCRLTQQLMAPTRVFGRPFRRDRWLRRASRQAHSPWLGAEDTDGPLVARIDPFRAKTRDSTIERSMPALYETKENIC
ncbi:MAG: hypothetical protein JSW47_14255 [Phycisphaerales bacterium]|nr:MAG: hypothetical protein JSW47_14255 [Phycisphaerales bacterium]